MSIQGINPAGGHASIAPGLARTRIGEEATQEPVRPADVPQTAPQRPQQPTRDLVPREAPSGTDPALWKVLSTDERAFFARAREMGPLTYGPGQSTEPEIPTVLQGGRIDVRV